MHLSIIIPTLNEAECIVRTINRAKSCLSGRLDVEFILVDAGSTDQTVELTRDLVDHSIEDQSLAGAKYKSLNLGATQAEGDMLFFLDADCLVCQDFDWSIFLSLSDTAVVGGAFEFQMDHPAFLYRMIEWLNRIRYRLVQNYYGDQGLFCRRSVFESMGGFRENPIMEAAYFCQRLRKKGKLKLINRPMLSSVRRFEHGGASQVMAKDTWIWMQFSVGLDISKYAKEYWEVNKKANKISI